MHYMQTDTWAAVKQAYGWRYKKSPLAVHGLDEVGIYSRAVPGLGRLYYVPNLDGVTLENAADFSGQIRQAVSNGFAIKLELYQPYDEQLLAALEKAGWRKARKHVQYRHTVQVDLKPDEQAILAGFKKRCRYEIKKSQSMGVVVEEAKPTDGNLQAMYELMQATSRRNKFYIRDNKFTMQYWQAFREKGSLRLFFARHQGDTLAGAVVLIHGDKAWYKDGGSVRTKASHLAPRLLQWEIMRALKAGGVKTYDLGGIPDPASYESSSMPGIYVFKAGYAREAVRFMPALELPLSRRHKLWPKAEPQWLRIYNLFAGNLWY